MEALLSIIPEAIAAAMGVLDRHLAALNSGDAVALAQTLHFPHYRLAGGRMKYGGARKPISRDFHARAGNEWHRSAWDFRNPISSSSDKVHLDVQFSRYRADGIATGSVSLHMGRWFGRPALGWHQLPSSFAA